MDKDQLNCDYYRPVWAIGTTSNIAFIGLTYDEAREHVKEVSKYYSGATIMTERAARKMCRMMVRHCEGI